MFAPDYRVPLDGRQARRTPPQVRITITPTADGWSDATSEARAQAVEAIITAQAGVLHSFIQGQRQQVDQNQDTFWAKRIVLDQLTISYTNSSGQEIIEIDVKPTNAPTSGGSLDISGVFVVDVPFTVFPIKLPPPAPPSWGAYAWDADDAAGDAQADAVGASGICIAPISGQVYFEVEIDVIPRGSAPATIVTTPGDADGSTLSTDLYNISPASISYLFPNDLDTFLTPVIGVVPDYYVDKSWKKNTVAYGRVIGCDWQDAPMAPRSIGLVPAKNRYTNYNASVWTNGRYVMKNTVYSTDFRDTYSLYSSSWASSVGSQILDTSPDGISTLVSGLTTYQCLNPQSRTDADKTVQLPVGGHYWIVGIQGAGVMLSGPRENPYAYIFADETTFPLGALQTLQAAHTSIFFDPKGAYYAFDNGLPNYPPGAQEINGGYDVDNVWPLNAETEGPLGTMTDVSYNWGYAGQFYNSVRVYAAWGMITFIPGSTKNSTTANYNLIGDVFQGPDFTYDDYCAEGGPDYKMPSGINQLGEHAWVIKGRGDKLASTLFSSNDVAIGNTVNGVLRNGCWTGMDMGSISRGDIYMIAVDTATRKVWFGRNGKWWENSAPTDKTPGTKLAPVTYLDGTAKDTKYYPACSARFGHTRMKVRYAKTTKYTPPPGFSPYDVVTIPTP